MTDIDMGHLEHLSGVADSAIKQIHAKESTYMGSWKRRGGSGAFHMLARKWDRIEHFAEQADYDIFRACLADTTGRDGTMLAEVMDLMTYLMLVMSEVVKRDIERRARTETQTRTRVPGGCVGGATVPETPTRYTQTGQEKWTPGTPEDGGHHDIG